MRPARTRLLSSSTSRHVQPGLEQLRSPPDAVRWSTTEIRWPRRQKARQGVEVKVGRAEVARLCGVCMRLAELAPAPGSPGRSLPATGLVFLYTIPLFPVPPLPRSNGDGGSDGRDGRDGRHPRPAQCGVTGALGEAVASVCEKERPSLVLRGTRCTLSVEHFCKRGIQARRHRSHETPHGEEVT